MLSIPHLIIIFVVALVVFGPEKLPDLARNLGKILGEFRRATGDLRTTFEGHLRELEREADQRRFSNPSVPSTLQNTAPPAAETTAEVPPSPNTVPADPPYAVAASAAEDEFPLQPASPSSPSSEAPSADELSEPPKSDPENLTETVSDGGQRPA